MPEATVTFALVMKPSEAVLTALGQAGFHQQTEADDRQSLQIKVQNGKTIKLLLFSPDDPDITSAYNYPVTITWIDLSSSTQGYGDLLSNRSRRYSSETALRVLLTQLPNGQANPIEYRKSQRSINTSLDTLDYTFHMTKTAETSDALAQYLSQLLTSLMSHPGLWDNNSNPLLPLVNSVEHLPQSMPLAKIINTLNSITDPLTKLWCLECAFARILKLNCKTQGKPWSPFAVPGLSVQQQTMINQLQEVVRRLVTEWVNRIKQSNKVLIKGSSDHQFLEALITQPSPLLSHTTSRFPYGIFVTDNVTCGNDSLARYADIQRKLRDEYLPADLFTFGADNNPLVTLINANQLRPEQATTILHYCPNPVTKLTLLANAFKAASTNGTVTEVQKTLRQLFNHCVEQHAEVLREHIKPFTQAAFMQRYSTIAAECKPPKPWRWPVPACGDFMCAPIADDIVLRGHADADVNSFPHDYGPRRH